MAQKRVSITVQLVVGQDDDLIKLFENVKGPERAAMIKARLMGQDYIPPRAVPDYRPVLEDMNGRVHWLQENVYNLPQMIQTTLEQMLAQMAMSPASIPPNIPPPKERATQAALDRRKERTKKQAW